MIQIQYTHKNVLEQALDMEANKTLAREKLPSYLNQVDCLDDLKVKGSALAKQIQILYNKQKNILISGFEASQYGIYFFFGNKLRIYYAIYYGIPRRILSFHLNNLHKLLNSLKIGLILIIVIGLLIFQKLFENCYVGQKCKFLLCSFLMATDEWPSISRKQVPILNNKLFPQVINTFASTKF